MATIEYKRTIDRRVDSSPPTGATPRTVTSHETAAFDQSPPRTLRVLGAFIACLLLLPIYLIPGLLTFALIGLAVPLGIFLSMLLLIPVVLFFSLLITASQVVFVMIGLI